MFFAVFTKKIVVFRSSLNDLQNVYCVLKNWCKIFSIWVVHIHYKLIYSYLCSAEQNNKTSLKNNNE